MSSLITRSANLVADSENIVQHADAGPTNASACTAFQGQRDLSPSTYPVVNMNLSNHLEVFNIPPLTALTMLCTHLNNIAKITGDVPLTPLKSSAVASDEQEDNRELVGNEKEPEKTAESYCAQEKDNSNNMAAQEAMQHTALAKRFYSKKTPPIALEEYMQRLHKYCPMSTAVYLATSVYITRMALIERTVTVTPRNTHRIVLAGLRVAMKALEDLSYPHSRFAKVGGVSDRELTRLEIAFCFLTDFDLRVDSQMMKLEVESLQRSRNLPQVDFNLNPNSLHFRVEARGKVADYGQLVPGLITASAIGTL